MIGLVSERVANPAGMVYRRGDGYTVVVTP
jgi:hypothetical protein